MNKLKTLVVVLALVAVSGVSFSLGRQSLRKLLAVLEPFDVRGSVWADCRSGGESNAPPTANLFLQLDDSVNLRKFDQVVQAAGWDAGKPYSGIHPFNLGNTSIYRTKDVLRVVSADVRC
jgi:hypothetical protein